MKHDQRLDRLLPGLTPTQRGILMLRDGKAGKDQDRQLLNTAPDNQAPELNRLIGLMNAANGDLAHLIVIIGERVKQEQLRFHWLAYARICAREMWAIGSRFHLSAREPITESEYRLREAEAREELIPVTECATILTEEYKGWADEDCELDEHGDRGPTDKAWYRTRAARVRELRALVAEGSLAGKGKGSHLKIACGSFYDWLGEPVPVVPDLGIAFDVRPDDRAQEVARERDDQAFMRELLNRGACKFDLPLDMESPLAIEPPEKGFGLEMARVLAVQLRAGVRENWRGLRAVDEQVEMIAAEFGGEDVLHSQLRENFDEAKVGLIELHAQVQEYTGPFDLPQPDEDVRAIAQRIVDNEVKHLRLR